MLHDNFHDHASRQLSRSRFTTIIHDITSRCVSRFAARLDSQDSSPDFDPLAPEETAGGDAGGCDDDDCDDDGDDDGGGGGGDDTVHDLTPGDGDEDATPKPDAAAAAKTVDSKSPAAAKTPATPASPVTPTKWKNRHATIETILHKADNFQWEELAIMGNSMINLVKNAKEPKGGWVLPSWGQRLEDDERGVKCWRSFTKKDKVNRAHDAFHDMSHDAIHDMPHDAIHDMSHDAIHDIYSLFSGKTATYATAPYRVQCQNFPVRWEFHLSSRGRGRRKNDARGATPRVR